MADTPDQVVRSFISLLVARDIETAATMVSTDFEYDNVPMGKAFGPQGLRDTLTGFFGMCTGIDWEIIRQTSTGSVQHGTVLNEREDRFEIHGRWSHCLLLASLRFAMDSSRCGVITLIRQRC